MTIWFSADPHFGHDIIRHFFRRPFRTTDEMDAHILERYQAVVEDNDDLWILGDFTDGDMNDAGRRRVAGIFNAIPGHKHLVTGNHDKRWVRDLPWTSVRDVADISVGWQRVILFHYPLMTWDGARQGAVQLFGHVHTNWPGSRNSVNVGVDLWDFRPIVLEQAMAFAATLPVHRMWDEVEPDTLLY